MHRNVENTLECGKCASVRNTGIGCGNTAIALCWALEELSLLTKNAENAFINGNWMWQHCFTEFKLIKNLSTFFWGKKHQLCKVSSLTRIGLKDKT